MSFALPRRITDSPLARRNPTVKLMLLFLVSVALLFLLDPVTPTVIYLLGLLGVIATTRIPPRLLAAAHLPFAAFAIGVFAVNVLSRPGEVVWQEGALRVTLDGIVIGAALAARTLAIGILSIGFVISTDAVALMTSLTQHARLGVRPAYAIMAGYRLLEQLPIEWTTIRAAQTVRAPLRRGRPRSGATAFARSAFALLVTAVRRGERVSLALESRGLGLAPRTVWRPVPLTLRDAALALLVLGMLAVVLILTGMAGVLRGPGALF